MSLTPIELNILLALSDHDRHGLGIAEDIESCTGGRMALGAGTLYGALKRLLDTGLVDEATRAPKGDRDDPRRRYYRITALGRKTVQQEAGQLAQLVHVAKARQVL